MSPGQFARRTAEIGRRPSRVATAVIAALLAVLLVAAGFGAARVLDDGPQQTVSARFVEAPGLYVGNRVAVLGVPKGMITRVTPHGTYVEVRMSLPRSVRIPAGASAAIVAPNPVTDRTVELFPAYTSGPVMRDGAVVPLTRTTVPLGIDDILGNLDDLTKALGPSGANRDGALSGVVGTTARLVKGNGARLNATLRALSLALPAFVQHPAQLEKLLRDLDSLTAVLAQHNNTIDSVIGAVTTATSQFAQERTTIAASVVNLQSALTQVVSFVKTNRSTLKTTLSNLLVTSKALVSDQSALRTTFSTAALGFQNAVNLIDPDTPCIGDRSKTCASAFARLDLPRGSTSITTTYCKDLISTFAPFLATVPGVSSLNDALKLLPKPTAQDSDCISQHALVDGHADSSPGAVTQPDLGLSRFLR